MAIFNLENKFANDVEEKSTVVQVSEKQNVLGWLKHIEHTLHVLYHDVIVGVYNKKKILASYSFQQQTVHKQLFPRWEWTYAQPFPTEVVSQLLLNFVTHYNLLSKVDLQHYFLKLLGRST